MKTARQRAEEWVEANIDGFDHWHIEAVEMLIKEQDKITRHACAEACLEHGDAPAIEMIDRCHAACINIKAV